MLSQKVKLGNIDDAEAFVHHCIDKGKILLTVDEREELVAIGLVILIELERKYDPARDRGNGGRTHGFFGYALYLLPRKLGDAWHKHNPHHVLRTLPDGTRRYDYLKTPRSWDEINDAPPTASAHRSFETTMRTAGNFVAVPSQVAA